MKKITIESGIKIHLPDSAYIDIYESCGDWLVDINDYGKTVQIKTTHDKDGKGFEYYNEKVLNRPQKTGGDDV